MFRILTLAAMALCSVPAQAASWYIYRNVFPPNALVFFDFDTVAKQGDKVTIWEKWVTKPGHPETDGRYATAAKSVYSCSKRTSQTLTSSTYDSKGDFLRTFPNPTTVQDMVPGSVGEDLLKVICASDFPRDKSGKDYSRVKDNNVFAFTKIYFDYIDAEQNDPAPK